MDGYIYEEKFKFLPLHYPAYYGQWTLFCDASDTLLYMYKLSLGLRTLVILCTVYGLIVPPEMKVAAG